MTLAEYLEAEIERLDKLIEAAKTERENAILEARMQLAAITGAANQKVECLKSEMRNAQLKFSEVSDGTEEIEK